MIDTLLLLEPMHGVMGAVVLLVVGAFVLRRQRQHQSLAVLNMIGERGRVIYTDSGGSSRSFLNKQYGIRAKPDFILELKGGEHAVVEYKSRDSGMLFASDVAQVKATVLAIRSRYPARRAFVVAGARCHEVKIKKSDSGLYKDIQQEIGYAREVAQGEMVKVFSSNERQCDRCFSRSRCLKYN